MEPGSAVESSGESQPLPHPPDPLPPQQPQVHLPPKPKGKKKSKKGSTTPARRYAAYSILENVCFFLYRQIKEKEFVDELYCEGDNV